MRWPGLRASLIKASNEAHLLDILDEEGSPGACTWSVYRGPLWVDLALPATAYVDEKHEGPLGVDDIAIEGASEIAEGRLRIELPDTDTAQEMETAVLRGAFPHTAAVLDILDEVPDDEAIRVAVAEDLIEHAVTTETRGVRIAEDMTLRLTTTWFFRRLDDGTFVEVPGCEMEDFMWGRRPLQPDADHAVRVIAADVTLSNKRPTSATLAAAWKFPVDDTGLVTRDYKAAMFTTLDELGKAVPEGVVDAEGRFRRRRQRALIWKPAAADVSSVAIAINEKAKHRIFAAQDNPTER